MAVGYLVLFPHSPSFLACVADEIQPNPGLNHVCDAGYFFPDVGGGTGVVGRAIEAV